MCSCLNTYVNRYDTAVCGFSCSANTHIVRRREQNYERRMKRQHTNRYIFEYNENQVIVCEKCFLNTLSISANSRYSYHKEKRWRSVVSRQEVDMNHISLFPVYESHYLRERLQKKYLGNNIQQENIGKEWQYADFLTTN